MVLMRTHLWTSQGLPSHSLDLILTILERDIGWTQCFETTHRYGEEGYSLLCRFHQVIYVRECPFDSLIKVGSLITYTYLASMMTASGWGQSEPSSGMHHVAEVIGSPLTFPWLQCNWHKAKYFHVIKRYMWRSKCSLMCTIWGKWECY